MKLKSKDKQIWFSSDWHYNHKNIVRGITEWGKDEDLGGVHSLQRTRDFKTLEEHNKVLVDNINKCCKEDHILFFLGDWSFGGLNSIKEFHDQLICKDIYFIYGNHDHHIENDKIVGSIIIGEEKMSIYSQDLFSSTEYYQKIVIDDQIICLCHFAMRVWDSSHRNSWMLYGHSHGTLDQMKSEFTNPTWIGDNYFIKNYKTMDVGIDTHPEFRPYSFEEIRDIMSTKEVLLSVDHHSENTN